MAAIKLYTNTIKGYIDITGNTLGLAGSDSSIKGGIRNFTTLAGGTTTTFSSNGSNAYLSIPTGGTVLHAQLFWSGAYRNTTYSKDVSASINNSINFTDPNGTTTVVTRNATNSQTMTTGTDYYANCVEVTSLVSAGGTGYYSVSNVPGILVGSGSVGDGDNWYLGWTLIVAIGDQSQPYRNMNIWALCDSDTNTTTGVINISGFATGPIGPYDGKLFISAGCGNSSLTGDSLQFGVNTSSFTNLSTTVHPSTNFFCGVISNRSGALQTLGTYGTANNTAGSVPASGNRSMYDITGVDMSSTLTVNQVTGVIRIYSTGDGVVANALAAEIRMNNVANLGQSFTCDVDKKYATVGDVLTYTLAIKNTGSSSATNLVFVNTVPAEASFVNDSLYIDNVNSLGGNPSAPNGISLGTLASNTVKTISFKITVNTLPSTTVIKNSSGIGYKFSPAATLADLDVYDVSQVATTTINMVYLSSNKIATNYVAVGDVISYTLVLNNTGSTTANNVTVYDTIPSYTSFITNSLKVNTVTQTGLNPNLGCNIGTLPIGSTTITFNVIANTLPSPNRISNSARIGYSFSRDSSTPNTLSGGIDTNVVVTTVNQVYLSTYQYSDVDFVYLGGSFTYILVLNSTGTTNANSAIITNGIPNGTTFITDSLKTNNVTQTVINPNLGLNIGTIPIGISTVTFKVKVVTIPGSYTLASTATINYTFIKDPLTLSQGSGNISTNTAITTINYAKISSTKNVDKQYASSKDILIYTLKISNIGTIDANNVVIKDTIPIGTSFLANSITVNDVATQGTPNNINIGSISAGAISTVRFNVKIES